jgi:hypothetical protein
MCELEMSDWQYSKAGGYFLLFVTVGQPLSSNLHQMAVKRNAKYIMIG